ncbi:carboxypeptidase regulatory-like domain-containing protein [Massilia glaciei]|nr:carboxypeptidase regulatory-like domain-containing protein [Massilia glaciei]
MPKLKIPLRALLLASAIVFAVSGCGSSKDDHVDPPVQVSTGTVAGRVADAQSGEPIAGVEVSIGTLKASSAADGKYSLPGVPLGIAVVARFSKPSYAANFATVEVIKDKTSTADRRLAKVAVRQDISAAAGGTVVLAGSAAQVQLPAAGFITHATSAPFTGTVSVEMTPIDPALNLLNMPGNYRAAGESTPIESFGALQIELRDASGALLNLAPGKTATIRIPVPEGTLSAPLSIPLYYFNETTGLWVREGTAALAGDAPRQYYEGQVSHFSTWNADQPYDTIYINGCVVNAAGQPVHASVATEGIDYIGTDAVSTSADGKFRVAARRSSQVQVGASSGDERDSVIVATGLTDMTLPVCLVVGKKPPVIVVQPSSLTLAPGAMNTLSVTANNADQYKWYRNGELINSGSRFMVIYGSASAAGTYHVVVSNAHGSVTSVTVTVTVATPTFAPAIAAQPQDVGVLAGAAPGFAVQALGDSLTYQWLRDGVEIASAQGPTLTLGPVSAADNGALFSVRVKNGAGTVVSRNAVLSVTAQAVAPGIAAQPSSTTVGVGQSGTFGVVASGTAPFTYQWLRNGAAIAGATGATYQTPAATLADNGARFAVRVSNAKGNVLSGDATLTVVQGSSVPGLHLAFLTGVGVNGDIGFGAIPAAGGAAVPFWPAGSGETAGVLLQGQISNGLASHVHVRGMLFWKNQQLIRRDLIGANGLPAEVRVSSLTSAGICDGDGGFAWEGGDVTDANLTWHVYRKSGVDARCGTSDDRYYAVRADMGALTAPLEVAQPLATVHSSTGVLSGWLVRNGQLLQRVNANFSNPVTMFTLPAADLDFDDDNTPLNNHWIFESGKKIYAVDLGVAAPATLTTVATLTGEESLGGVTYANQQDIVIALWSGDGASTRIVRFVTGTKAVNAVATVSGHTSANMVTPTRVVLHGALGTAHSVPLSGGTPQPIYTAPQGSFAYSLQRGGERLWYETNDSVVSMNSDGSAMQTLPGARLAGCILKPLYSIEYSFRDCDAVMVLEGSTVRSHDAATGAARITYGAITLPNAPLTNRLFFDFLTAWGEHGILSQYIADPDKPDNQSVVSYLIKTDQAGISQIVMP